MPCASVLVFIKQVTFGKRYKSWSSSFCNFLHSPVSSSLTHPNISLSTTLSNTLNVPDQVALPYKTTGNITSFTSSQFHPAMEPSRTRPTFRDPLIPILCREANGAVIEIRHGLDGSGFEPRWQQIVFSPPQSTLGLTQPPVQSVSELSVTLSTNPT